MLLVLHWTGPAIGWSYTHWEYSEHNTHLMLLQIGRDNKMFPFTKTINTQHLKFKTCHWFDRHIWPSVPWRGGGQQRCRTCKSFGDLFPWIPSAKQGGNGKPTLDLTVHSLKSEPSIGAHLKIQMYQELYFHGQLTGHWKANWGCFHHTVHFQFTLKICWVLCHHHQAVVDLVESLSENIGALLQYQFDRVVAGQRAVDAACE